MIPKRMLQRNRPVPRHICDQLGGNRGSAFIALLSPICLSNYFLGQEVF